MKVDVWLLQRLVSVSLPSAILTSSVTENKEEPGLWLAEVGICCSSSQVQGMNRAVTHFQG